jgi:peptidoglycan/xylan/chitin deacetylase (PgdA/CDA1 family)
VVLTFDDGYIDHYQYVFPILRELGFTGTFFIITDTADRNVPGYLSWAQITEMAEAGMSMESHSKVHLDLRDRDWDFLVHQVAGSLESLQAQTGESASMLCYPAGQYDETTLELLGKLPVSLAVTTRHGAMHTTSERLELARLRISNGTSVTGLGNLLASSG